MVAFFKNINTLICEKNIRRNYFCYGDYNYNYDMLINYFNYQLTPKHRFYRDEKLFEFFSFENDFAKYFIKYCNSLI